ncbi:uncharacterized protein LOC124390276 [Silurus meridionalis]|uniref:uncharacterized protein LOC124390276 n=1 Tax=Silurus meridionalis TaxID=175797 RepID=UPI001EEC2988|nr:uncharacterized protein LOC124390276 [Silurus meridionalis]
MNPEQPEEDFKERQNSWGTPELFLAGRHVSLQSLKEKRIQNRYLGKNITPYPSPVEFWVSDVTHVTDKSGYKGIMKSEAFKPGKEFSWWSLKINENEILEAEQRYMERNDVLEPFLKKFTTSPAFKPESRFGNYRFTFPLTDLIKWYKEQNCGGKEPVLRVHETVIYKQKIMYTVLIHSPEDNKRFGKYPLLENSEWVNYQDGKIVWKAQAICETHSYQFISGTAIKINTEYPEYYVWDQVCLVFHLPPPKTLKISKDDLKNSFSLCERMTNKDNQTHEEYREAVNKMEELKVSKKQEKKKP